MSNKHEQNRQPEPKVESNSMEKAIASAIEQALPAAVGAAVTAMRGPQQVAQPAKPQLQRGLRCPECNQQVRACKREHRLAVIFPKMAVLEDLFPGIRLNGVTYISGGPDHRITIPKDSDLENQVAAWEERELINLRGRKKQRRSGVFSPHGSQVNREPVAM